MGNAPSTTAVAGYGNTPLSSMTDTTSITTMSNSTPISSTAINTDTADNATYVITPSGCPPITVSTKTYPSEYKVYIYPTVTTTSVVNLVSTVINFTSTATYVEYLTTYSPIIYSTVNTTTHTILAATADTTITMPTSPGFTPIQCNPTYYQPTTIVPAPFTINIGSTEVIAAYNYTSTTYLAETFPDFVYQTVTAPYTSSTTATVNVTSTRVEATHTAYAACAPNNLAVYLPYGHTIDGISGEVFNGRVYTTYVNQTLAVDATDCCEMCQGAFGCTGSAYSAFADDYPGCTLYFPASDVCDPDYGGQLAERYYNELSYYPRYNISNSGCGQWNLTVDVYTK